MKKIILTIQTVITLIIFLNLNNGVLAVADWWTRPSALPTQPHLEREFPLPTLFLRPTNPPEDPTSAPSPNPTISPTNPPTGGAPSDGGGGGTGEDPCAAGKSYTGSYCGWSPSTSQAGDLAPARVGGPEVLGLSDTSSGDVALSDIIFLAGVLCLLVYTKSKIAQNLSR